MKIKEEDLNEYAFNVVKDPKYQIITNEGEEEIRTIAYIREDECIGCTKCIQACPVDAILGAAKLMHTVIADECTGCDLCVEPCPVDCIDMLPIVENIHQWQWSAPENSADLIATTASGMHEDAA